MTEALRLVVFDVDGTLIDSQNHIVGAMEAAFGASGHVLPSRQEVLSIVGLSLPVAIERLVPHLPACDRAGIVEAYTQSFGRLRAEGTSPLYPGAVAALDVLGSRP